MPSTAEIVQPFYGGIDVAYRKYITSGFLTIQRALAEAALATSAGARAYSPADPDAGLPRVWAAPFPVARFSRNGFYDSVGPLLGLVLCLSLLYPLGMLIKARPV